MVGSFCVTPPLHTKQLCHWPCAHWSVYRFTLLQSRWQLSTVKGGAVWSTAQHTTRVWEHRLYRWLVPWAALRLPLSESVLGWQEFLVAGKVRWGKPLKLKCQPGQQSKNLSARSRISFIWVVLENLTKKWFPALLLTPVVAHPFPINYFWFWALSI